jgi:hypothetical protein
VKGKIKMLNPILPSLLLLIFGFLSFANCYASTVLEVSLDDMLQNAEFVFEGNVIAVESKQSDPKRIHTYVTFEVEDVIKGDYPKREITIRYLGGQVENLTVKVSGLRLPELGEHGIYFVESIRRNQVNPIFGWDQGHFIINKDGNGNQRLLTNKRLPVLAVKKNAVPSEKKINSRGVARELEVGQTDESDKALTVEQFKDILHERLEKK